MTVQQPTKIKVCGLTRAEDVRECLRLGVEFIGVNFYPGSSRHVSLELAEMLTATMREEGKGQPDAHPTRLVAVLVNPDPRFVNEVIARAQPDVLQFHGEEDRPFCEQFHHPFIKAFRTRDVSVTGEIDTFMGEHPLPCLVDAWSPDQHGGTGATIDLPVAKAVLQCHEGFLAGGLTPQNVGHAIREIRPYGVDVASGVESSPGIKSGQLMREFVDSVRHA